MWNVTQCLWDTGFWIHRIRAQRRLGRIGTVQRHTIAARENWRAQAEELGFAFHTIDGQAYWVDDAYYQFSLKQIEEDIEAPSLELHEMAMAFVAGAAVQPHDQGIRVVPLVMQRHKEGQRAVRTGNVLQNRLLDLGLNFG